MFGNESTQPSKFKKKNGFKQLIIEEEYTEQIIFKTTMLKSRSCDYSDIYIYAFLEEL